MPTKKLYKTQKEWDDFNKSMAIIFETEYKQSTFDPVIVELCDIDFVPWNVGRKGDKYPTASEKKRGISPQVNNMKITCIHCNKTTDPGNYNRWHGDKCSVIGYIRPKLTDEHKAKASKALTGRKFTEEHKKKLSESHKKRCCKKTTLEE
jgi:hypothetical protein